MESLQSILRFVRQRAGLSARDLSLKAGLSAAYVNKLESGELAPSLKAFAALAKVLDLSAQEILFCVGLSQEDDGKP